MPSTAMSFFPFRHFIILRKDHILVSTSEDDWPGTAVTSWLQEIMPLLYEAEPQRLKEVIHCEVVKPTDGSTSFWHNTQNSYCDAQYFRHRRKYKEEGFLISLCCKGHQVLQRHVPFRSYLLPEASHKFLFHKYYSYFNRHQAFRNVHSVRYPMLCNLNI